MTAEVSTKNDHLAAVGGSAANVVDDALKRVDALVLKPGELARIDVDLRKWAGRPTESNTYKLLMTVERISDWGMILFSDLGNDVYGDQ